MKPTTCATRDCDRTDTRPYLTGPQCPDHAPNHATPPPWTGKATRAQPTTDRTLIDTRKRTGRRT